MKLSENKIIKMLNHLSTLVLIFYILFLVINLFSSTAPITSKSLKGYEVFNVIAKKTKETDNLDHLTTWFKNKVVVQETDRALVHLRFKSYEELFSLPAIGFQLAVLCYWLLIGFLIVCVKRFFLSLTRDEVFTRRNASIIMFASLSLIWLPIIRWLVQELFINCIERLSLNDSGYLLENGEHLFGSETIIGLTLFAFGWAFKVGVNMKNENESFI